MYVHTVAWQYKYCDCGSLICYYPYPYASSYQEYRTIAQKPISWWTQSMSTCTPAWPSLRTRQCARRSWDQTTYFHTHSQLTGDRHFWSYPSKEREGESMWRRNGHTRYHWLTQYLVFSQQIYRYTHVYMYTTPSNSALTLVVLKTFSTKEIQPLTISN